MVINYPKEFKEKCKKVYPDWTQLHNFLDLNNPYAGRLLNDAALDVISPEDIINATSLDELKNKALAIKEKEELYSEWYKIFSSQPE